MCVDRSRGDAAANESVDPRGEYVRTLFAVHTYRVRLACATTDASSTKITRDQRTNIRASAQQQLLIRRPAEATDSTVTDFILDSALESAKRVLADRKRFVASEEQWVEFQTLLDAPLEPMPKLRRLLRRESTFADND
ncbi:DUF1778 domain-containing protein [Mycolicibacterium conceptionense]|uniref:type II toxin-antitoxin system TacA family antitoxin n=1 Tax=Mycolicibacterium conceptionense TaxID=451644 RepID=UPI0009BD09B3|nr:DUF1778 domain-containing protein [Mycolicibacterium conceptionense]